jgi:hypothetical protein
MPNAELSPQSRDLLGQWFQDKLTPTEYKMIDCITFYSSHHPGSSFRSILSLSVGEVIDFCEKNGGPRWE